MKGGQTPIHIQRWAPADYHEDEHVKVLKARHDYRALTFYRHFIDRSYIQGGDLPADLEALSAAVEMPQRDVEHALAFCVGRLIQKEEGRLFQRRVRREVRKELKFRRRQRKEGRKGGRPKHKKGSRKASVLDHESPPTPYAGADAGADADAFTPTPFDPTGGEERAGGVVPSAATPPASSSPLPDHDPNVPHEVQLAERCLALARRDVADQGREPTAVEVLGVLEALSDTGNGNAIRRIRGAPRKWIEQTLEVGERFEREVFEGGNDPPKEE